MARLGRLLLVDPAAQCLACFRDALAQAGSVVTAAVTSSPGRPAAVAGQADVRLAIRYLIIS